MSGRFLWTLLAVLVMACSSPGATGQSALTGSSILVVQRGEPVQAAPSNEVMAEAFSGAMEMAEQNGKDLGYPWIDPSSGELVLSAVTPEGRAVIEGAEISARYRIRDVKYGVEDLVRIQEAVTGLRAEGVPGADLILATVPDHRDNRILVVLSAASTDFVFALGERLPKDALAIQVGL